jgi:DNA polymerase-3 subunit gamma/tau
MVYQVLARKWRPQLFEEVVGQDHVVRTLRNAISLGRVAHAYLFTGQRGVGKTSTARILAKALNCKIGPTPTPCNRCESCKEIMRSESLDVLEIDGASNRGIDEIRNLRQRVRFSPVRGKFRIYIIDEIHMLTNPAFNALLKTLEEPPSHVVFIFATTNPHKLPSTIVSRCQRFDFRKIATSDILTRLKQIVRKENIVITPEALGLIAEGAENSMRDAEKVLDQAISYTEGNISEKDVANLLGMVEKRYLFKLTENLAKADTLANIILVDQLLEEGKDPQWLIKSWQKWLRNLMMLKMGGENLTFLPKVERKEAEGQASHFSLKEIVRFIDLLSKTSQRMVLSSQPQVHLELLMVELSSDFEMDNLALREPELARIYQRILKLEEKLTARSSGSMTQEKKEPKKEGKKEKKEKIGLPTLEMAPDRVSYSKANEDKKFHQKWELIVDEIEERKKTLGTILRKATILKITLDSLTLGVEKPFHKETLSKKENLRLIREVLEKFLSSSFTLHYVLAEPEHERKKEERPQDQKWQTMVAQAMDLFEGEIVKDTTRR